MEIEFRLWPWVGSWSWGWGSRVMVGAKNGVGSWGSIRVGLNLDLVLGAGFVELT